MGYKLNIPVVESLREIYKNGHTTDYFMLAR